MLVAGCEKKETIIAPTVTGTGAILVTVYDSQGSVVPSASVITNPKIGNGSWVTDGLGQVLLENVPGGIYTIAATRASLGSARDAANVTARTLSHVDLHLVPGVFLEPQVRILQPSYGFAYSYIDSLNLSEADAYKVYEGTARTVFPRLDARLKTRGK